ncbi:MAG: ABC transporter substrate-binding protein [Candidatus Eisenbacteria bacterium]
MRRLVRLLVTIVLFLVPLCAEASERVRILAVFSTEMSAYREAWSGFQSHLLDKGVPVNASKYVLKADDATVPYSEMPGEGPDILVAFGSRAAKLAAGRAKDIPVISCGIVNPQEVSGSDRTGVSMEIPLETKLLGIKKMLGGAKRIGLLYSPETRTTYRELSRKCDERGFSLVAREVSSNAELSTALDEIAGKIDCFVMISDTRIYSAVSVKHLFRRSFEDGFPVVGLSSVYTRAGALFSFDCDYEELGRQAARIALRILAGEKPGDIPVSGPRRTRLSINLLAAERMGIHVPPWVLKEASEVFGR